MGKIIAIANQKGGVGKTTTTINLAACIGEFGKSVLLVDIDPQGNTTSGTGVRKKHIKENLYTVLMQSGNVEDAIIKTAHKNLSVLPSDMNLAGAEVELIKQMSRENALKSALDKIRHRYDFIFIDCPPSLSILTINALTAADSVLIPVQCEYFALEGLSQLTNTMRQVKKQYNPGLLLEGVVLTMYDGRLNLTIQVVEEVKRHFMDKVFASVIPRAVRLSEAPSHGLPITVYDKFSKAAESYRNLANEFLKRQG